MKWLKNASLFPKFARQLQWQIVGSQIIVTVVTIGVVMIMTRTIFLGVLPINIEPIMRGLVEGGPGGIDEAINQITVTFRNVVIFSTFVAAVGAIFIGWFNSLLLSRLILVPLQILNKSTERIADGRYDERVPVPTTEELESMATQFNQMAKSLENVEENRVSLIGNVSHELRTPLSALQGYVEGLQDGLFEQSDETYDIMREELDRLRRLVSDLQVLSKVEGGKIPIKTSEFEIIPLIHYVVRQLKPQTVSKNLEIKLSLERIGFEGEHELIAIGDRDRASQVLFNLIGNAIRYTPPNGQIEIEVIETADAFYIDISDNGIGIPADSIPYLFERFYRVDSSRSRKSGGSGIGLTIARHLARRMGGDVTAKSEGLHKGSTFTFSLPAKFQLEG
ncbi:MAG: HAMP domain-containing sensor histidine kinase [Chloroflexota bacterium]